MQKHSEFAGDRNAFIKQNTKGRTLSDRPLIPPTMTEVFRNLNSIDEK